MLTVANQPYHLCDLSTLEKAARLPYALKILLENLLRYEDGKTVRREDIDALLNWDPHAAPNYEIVFRPGRVLLQDFTGVPVIVDLAAMRDAIVQLGGQAQKINPLSPVDLVIDHSVTVERFGSSTAFENNTDIEFQQNQERYRFLRWGQRAFENFRVVPPGTGIVHQVNLEYLAKVVSTKNVDGALWAYPDTVVGTDSHTTMINGLGILGWGVGGIEAEAAMLGQPIPLLIPEVVGVRLTGKLCEGATATDLVLVIVEQLRKHGVVGKFVEFFGEGVQHIAVTDRATIANMAPEYGATCGLFPIDAQTLRFLQLTGRTEDEIALVEGYARAQGFFHTPDAIEAQYSSTLTLDLASVVPSIAGPKRPQDRIALIDAKNAFTRAIYAECHQDMAVVTRSLPCPALGQDVALKQGAVLIAAITSCTNTSNPAVMLAAGLLAKKAIARGLKTPAWVKTSLAPGSQVVTDYLKKANVMGDLEALGFYLVGYGCTTCIGNSGPLADPIRDLLKENPDFVGAAVLSGNRNFEGRIHPQVRYAYLASPPLVVAYALAGTMDIDLYQDAIGTDPAGKLVYLEDIWPTQAEIAEAMASFITPSLFSQRYQSVFAGSAPWQSLPTAEGDLCAWDSDSTYVKHPPYFEGMPATPAPLQDITGARVLALLGDSVTTDHISPAGSIALDSPAGTYLRGLGVAQSAFNSYGSRRGNHEVMVRGTFANIRLKNHLAEGKEGGWTKYYPTETIMTIYDAAMAYQTTHTPLIILAGKEYGTGSSRDWAAKGVHLLGVTAVIAETFERIHRSNLIGMGVLPLEFLPNENASTLGLTGAEIFTISLADLTPKKRLVVQYTRGETNGTFETQLRIDTLIELDYFRHGGILQYVLRQLATT